MVSKGWLACKLRPSERFDSAHEVLLALFHRDGAGSGLVPVSEQVLLISTEKMLALGSKTMQIQNQFTAGPRNGDQ